MVDKTPPEKCHLTCQLRIDLNSDRKYIADLPLTCQMTFFRRSLVDHDFFLHGQTPLLIRHRYRKIYIFYKSIFTNPL